MALGSSFRSALVAVDLGGTVEDSWSYKRIWYKARGFDLGPLPQGRREVIRDTDGRTDLYDQMVAEVYCDASIAKHHAVEGAKAGLKELAQRHELVILSSRKEEKRAATIGWLAAQSLEVFFKDVLCLGDNGNKLRWCAEHGADFLVDDDLRHLETHMEARDVTTIHYCSSAEPARKMPAGVFCAKNWERVAGIDDLMTSNLEGRRVSRLGAASLISLRRGGH